jgi:phage tail-like protein
MPRVQLPLIHLDTTSTLGDGAVRRPALINRIPEPGETDFPVGVPLELEIVDVGTTGLATVTQIDVTDTLGTVVAFVQGVGFHATYAANSTFTIAQSPGSSVDDEQYIVLVRDTEFSSEEPISIRVQAATLDAKTLDEIYTFQIEDNTQPEIVEVKTLGLKKLIVTFDEPVLMDASQYGALRVREISGRVNFIAPDFINAEKGEFSSGSVEDFIYASGADEALNNDYFEILNSLSTQEIVTQEDTVATEPANLSVRCWTGPYKIIPNMEPERLIPSFSPAIIAVTQINEQTIELELLQELSPGRPYYLIAHNIGDDAFPINVAQEIITTFTAEPLPVVANRNIRLWEDLTPSINKQEDSSGDNQRFVRCLDDVVQFLTYDTDRFGDLLDPIFTPAKALDPLLVHLGNPFTFVNDELTKRKTINGLVQTFKDSGVERGIENAVQFFLGLDVDVRPFNLLEGWILGESFLGIDTYLNTDVKFLLYSFEIASDVVLTDVQRATITEIANVIRPAHTHFVRFVEP